MSSDERQGAAREGKRTYLAAGESYSDDGELVASRQELRLDGRRRGHLGGLLEKDRDIIEVRDAS